MLHSNIITGSGVEVHHSASVNNVKLGNGVAIGRKATLFGSPDNLLEIGQDSMIGSYTILNGYASKLVIGESCSVGSFCHFITDTGPTASPALLKRYPISRGSISIGSHSVIGDGCVVIAGVSIGEEAYVMPNSFVNKDVPPRTVFGGSPAVLIRTIEPGELT